MCRRRARNATPRRRAPVSKIKSEGCPALRRWRLSSLAVAGSSLLSADVDAGAELRETWKHSKIFFQHIWTKFKESAVVEDVIEETILLKVS